ncbi:kinase-like protein [Penicillium malachiteum]|uniref:Kinase-like protein n=1 Tax=Penicillium malachiteum TaxID=1324776 RepID=A0AAD6HG71_9EURO|nr:kinase-like protein [Penicillium malachiteum]
MRFIPKICDFGSPVTTEKPCRVDEYYGTPTWLPPEKHCELKMDIDLRKCDVFAYGLVVWAIFTKTAFSPTSGLDTDTIRTKWGKHFIFARASEEVNIHLKEKPQRDESLLSSGFSNLFDIFRSHSQDPSTVSTRNYGPEVNQVLTVLSLALNDHPFLRSSQPWIYLRQGLAQSPVKFPRSFKRDAKIEDVTIPNSLVIATKKLITHSRKFQAEIHRFGSTLLEFLPSISRPGFRFCALVF